MSLRDAEFQVLRATVASRGTVRQALVPVTVIGWGVTATLLTSGIQTTVISLVSLAVLVAGFEAIHALHVGVERVGRYLQVFYENGLDGPSWESTAMRIGPGLPGGGIDPLFSILFAMTTAVNLFLLAWPANTDWDVAVVFVHLAFVVRIVRARRAAAQQRAVDLETFTAVRAQFLKPPHAGPSPDRPSL